MFKENQLTSLIHSNKNKEKFARFFSIFWREQFNIAAEVLQGHLVKMQVVPSHNFRLTV